VKRSAFSGQRRLSDVRALVVDDSEVNVEVGKSILELEGAVVRTAANGQEAVAMVLSDAKAFDVVLMDLQMPVLDGHDAFRRISAVLGAQRPVVIALTAGSPTESPDEERASGMDDWMHKPFDVDALVDCIRQHLSLGERATRPPPDATEAVPSWPTLPGVDTALARMSMGGNRELFVSSLRIFLRQYRNVDAMQSTRELDEIRQRMHRLKGSSGTIGATGLRALALETESLSKQGDAEGALAGLGRVCQEIDEFRGHIEAYLSSLEAKAA